MPTDKQRQADHQQAGDRAAIERHPHGRGAGLTGRLGGAHIGQDRDAHADVTGGERAERADQKADGGGLICEK